MSSRANDSQARARARPRGPADPDPLLIEAIGARQAPGKASPRVIQTSGAWVILSGDEAWKCRRPRQTGFADLTRAHLRRAACAAELQLNRRFCPEVYLGLAALLVGGDARAELVEVDTPGVPLPHDTEPIEWVIRMKRLAAARFLDAALDSGRLDPEGVHRIAMRLSTLHARAPVSSIEPCDFAERFAAEIRTGAEVLGEWAGSAAALLSDRAWSLRGALEIRVREAAVIDGHGDLRPEHLSIGDEVRLIDALDCDARLRQLDPWEELSLLALMADERGAAWFGPLLARTYESGVHRPPPDLLAFYCAYHAFTRSRLAFDHLRRNPRQRVHHWGRLTRRFMRMTEAALQGWSALGEIR